MLILNLFLCAVAAVAIQFKILTALITIEITITLFNSIVFNGYNQFPPVY